MSENIHRLDLVYTIYILLNIDEVYMLYIHLLLPYSNIVCIDINIFGQFRMMMEYIQIPETCSER